MLATLSSITSRQSKGTEQLKEEVKQPLDYCATHPNVGVRFVAIDMFLAIHSDASYLSEPDSKIRAVGHHYLSKLNDEKFNKWCSSNSNPKKQRRHDIRLSRVNPQMKTQVTTKNNTSHGLITKMTPKVAKAYNMISN